MFMFYTFNISNFHHFHRRYFVPEILLCLVKENSVGIFDEREYLILSHSTNHYKIIYSRKIHQNYVKFYI